jgi:hypothetical protein
MVRAIRDAMYEETKDLSREELKAYFTREATALRQETRRLVRPAPKGRNLNSLGRQPQGIAAVFPRPKPRRGDTVRHDGCRPFRAPGFRGARVPRADARGYSNFAPFGGEAMPRARVEIIQL